MADTQRCLSQAEAIREALAQAMAADPRVILLGEGVPDPKHIFGTTAGLQEQFGPQRVFDTPLAENGMTGIAIGAALAGMRPVMVHQRIDFMLLCADQIINNAAKWRYVFAGRAHVPLVIRTVVGRGWGQGPQHAQALHSLFAHIPGLRVALPVTAHDAKGMLLAAIACDDPVLFVEHRWLHGLVDQVPEAPYIAPLEQAAIRRPGRDVTIAAFSYMVVESLLAAEALAEQGWEVEVLDMRMARPLDVAGVAASVARTGHLVAADIGWKTGGIAGELVAAITEQCWGQLAAAPARVTLPDLPAPTSHFLAADYYPDATSIALAVVAQRPDKTLDREQLQARLRRTTPADAPQKEFTGPF
ncbi:alpha-ketoacid dehydrogenase subunit beta [Azospira sp. I09]|jgi:pyruvate dehydrogenase E1 component beta subunit|uniref:alpha-ketoacid dehydrogenase subunit beta n=1 Tax=Azospira sp. I09 TaxID=1765049 RepID=UPI0012607F14|nr:transketolase C-terminal domain-containing protein [Azospira sp. I09]